MDCDQIFRKRDGFDSHLQFGQYTKAHIIFTFCYKVGEACGFIFRLSIAVCSEGV